MFQGLQQTERLLGVSNGLAGLLLAPLSGGLGVNGRPYDFIWHNPSRVGALILAENGL